jgi:hypothetical protein
VEAAWGRLSKFYIQFFLNKIACAIKSYLPVNCLLHAAMGDFLDALEPELSSQEGPGRQHDHDDGLTELSRKEATGNMFLFGADAKSRATPGIVMPMAQEESIDAQEVPIISSGAKKTLHLKSLRRNCSTPGCTKKAQVKGLCKSHGGVRNCLHPGCTKRQLSRGRCFAHGGGKTCTRRGCNKQGDRGGLCGFHASHPKAVS